MRNDGKHKIELEWKGQGISQMKMDGQVIPPSDYGKYADVIA